MKIDDTVRSSGEIIVIIKSCSAADERNDVVVVDVNLEIICLHCTSHYCYYYYYCDIDVTGVGLFIK